MGCFFHHHKDTRTYFMCTQYIDSTMYPYYRGTQCHRSILLITLQTTLISAVSLGYGKMALYFTCSK
jgi:hypothetical protein